MMDRDLVDQLAVVVALRQRVKEEEDRLRGLVAGQLRPGDRVTPTLPDGTKLGAVSYTEGRRKPVVVDDQAFLRWVTANHPSELVTQVRDSYRKAVLDRAGKDGVAVDPASGEVIPGVDVVAGEPYLAVRLNGDALPAVSAAWASGSITPPALPGGDA